MLDSSGNEAVRPGTGEGATVILGVRNVKAAEDVVKKIKDKHKGAKVVVGPALDLLSQESVRKFAEHFNKNYDKLHILVNNAGVSFMQRTMTPEGVGGIAQASLTACCPAARGRAAAASPAAPAMRCHPLGAEVFVH
jgi:NAD(P)-dependent dehydrogenase (short-subunit alcohol dehydrogenase family)